MQLRRVHAMRHFSKLKIYIKLNGNIFTIPNPLHKISIASSKDLMQYGPMGLFSRVVTIELGSKRPDFRLPIISETLNLKLNLIVAFVL